jgi:hypothetical protein
VAENSKHVRDRSGDCILFGVLMVGAFLGSVGTLLVAPQVYCPPLAHSSLVDWTPTTCDQAPLNPDVDDIAPHWEHRT